MLSQLDDVDELIDMGFLKNHASVIIKCAKNTEEIQQSEHVDAQDRATETSEMTSKPRTVTGLGTWSA